jgi:hypothetical protein
MEKETFSQKRKPEKKFLLRRGNLKGNLFS